MSDGKIPRREVAELLARYHLEPTIRDVYVEGPFDVDVFRWFFDQQRLDVEVYDIDTVEIGFEILSELGLDEGKRCRVITLAHLLNAKVAPSQVACVIDADFDRWLGLSNPLPLLLCTDYVCMEMYLLNNPTLRKFLQLVASIDDLAPQDFVGLLRGVLEECFLIRLAHHNLGLRLSWITPERCCSFAAGQPIHFEVDDFLGRLLNRTGAMGKRAELKEQMSVFRKSLSADLRHQANGHDLTSLIGWFMHKLNVSWLRKPGIVARSLLGCVTMAEIEGETLFRTLLGRFSASSHAA